MLWIIEQFLVQMPGYPDDLHPSVTHHRLMGDFIKFYFIQLFHQLLELHQDGGTNILGEEAIKHRTNALLIDRPPVFRSTRIGQSECFGETENSNYSEDFD